MVSDYIRYDLLVQEALRGVIRQILTDATHDGLPGDHHFYISFNTHAEGVKISPALLKRFPEEMTIVLQHQYWDFNVFPDGFEITLSFSNVAENLYVPFLAITGFLDPSVQFGLKFTLENNETETLSEISSSPLDSFKTTSSVEPFKNTSKDSLKNISPLDTEKNPSRSDSEEAHSTKDNTSQEKIIQLDVFRKK